MRRGNDVCKTVERKKKITTTTVIEMQAGRNPDVIAEVIKYAC